MSDTPTSDDGAVQPAASEQHGSDGGDERLRVGLNQIWSRDWRALSGEAVLAVVAVTFGFAAGLEGLAVGILLGLAWTLLPTVAVFAVGVVGLAAIVPGDAGVFSLALPVVALAGLLVTTGVSTSRRRDATVVLSGWIALGGITAAVYMLTETLWIAAVTLITVGVAGFISLSVNALTRTNVIDE